MVSLFSKSPVVITKSQQAATIAANAINMFTTASDQLKKSNQIAQEAIVENHAEIKRLKAESDEMDRNVTANQAIIGNIEKFLGITVLTDVSENSSS